MYIRIYVSFVLLWLLIIYLALVVIFYYLYCHVITTYRDSLAIIHDDVDIRRYN